MTGAASDRNVVVLNDIHIDIMDYIVPASCNDSEFRQMWAEFEWENKVAVNTNISGLKGFLQHVIKCTNMKCLTPEKVLCNSFSKTFLICVNYICFIWHFCKFINRMSGNIETCIAFFLFLPYPVICSTSKLVNFYLNVVQSWHFHRESIIWYS